MSVLGYAEVTANQTGIGAETDLTGLSVTVTVPAGATIRVTGGGTCQKVSLAGWIFGYIKESTTYLGRWFGHEPPANEFYRGQGSVILTPSAGSHTYKLSLQAQNNTVSLIAAAGFPAFILAEDISTEESVTVDTAAARVVLRAAVTEIVLSATAVDTAAARVVLRAAVTTVDSVTVVDTQAARFVLRAGVTSVDGGTVIAIGDIVCTVIQPAVTCAILSPSAECEIL